MNDPVQMLRDRLAQAVGPAGADAVLALGDLEIRWEVRGGDPEDQWYYRTNDRADAERTAKEKRGELFVLTSLRFMPLAAGQTDEHLEAS